jgi:tetratricopeptide (TPR) repeat protein
LTQENDREASSQAAAFVSRAHGLRLQGLPHEAIELYRTAIDLRPDLAEAHNGMGIAWIHLGDIHQAIESFRAAIAAAPGYPDAYNNLGNAHDQCGQSEDAVAAFRTAIRLRPGYAKAYVHLAEALRRLGRPGEAEKTARTALVLWPAEPQIHYTLGAALRSQGRFGEAVSSFRSAIGLRSDFAEAHNDLGDALHALGRLAEAEASYRQAIDARPTYAEAHTNLGTLLTELGRVDEAAAMLRRAVELKPSLAGARINLAGFLITHGRGHEAEPILRETIEAEPNLIYARTNLGASLVLQGRIDEAEAEYRHALTIDPGEGLAHLALGETLLAQGRFEEGWSEFGWRWKIEDWPDPPRTYPQPLWRGEPLQGRRILLYGEAGFGDVIQFVRFATVVAERGGTVIAEVFPQLERLIATVPGVAEVVRPGHSSLTFDYHLPFMDIPDVVGTTLTTVPAAMPYLRPPGDTANRWKARVAGQSGLKVGLAWAGDPRPRRFRENAIDRRRSMRLDRLASLFEVPDVTFFSLQKGTAAEQVKEVPTDRRPIDLMDEMSDFADTAALVANLDLVITVDTAIAHLAGAMAKPVWILSRFDGCWRWLRDRDDSPWYPTARLFRQMQPGDWDEVIGRVRSELSRIAGSGDPARDR